MSFCRSRRGAHLSVVDYLGDVPWSEDEAAKNWYARVKSRPSFRPLLAETLAGTAAVARATPTWIFERRRRAQGGAAPEGRGASASTPSASRGRTPFREAGARLEHFLADGAHGDMAWMAASAERRGEPRTLWPRGALGDHARHELRARRTIRWRSCGDATAARSRSMPRATTITTSSSRGSRRWRAGWSAQAGGDVKVFVDTAAVMEKPLAARPASAGRASTPTWCRANSAPGCSSARCSPRSTCRPTTPEAGSLRHLPRLPRHLPDRGVPRALSARCAALHLLSHHRAQGTDPARIAPADGQPHLWLRRLPRGLPVEQVRAGRPRGQACRARGPARAAARRTGAARRRGVPRAVCQDRGQAHRPRPLRAQCADRDRQLRRCRAGAARRAVARRRLARWCAARRSGRSAASTPARLAAHARLARPETDPAVAEEWAAAAER